MNPSKLETKTGAELIAEPFAPTKFIVDALIPPGLHILGGAPKIGKSWLALWLSVMVAKGESVWDLPTRQGTTLYLCLEDSTARIQNRLLDIDEDASEATKFSTSALTISRGLEEQIENFVAEHSDTVLIIIDTLQMIRSGTQDHNYAQDYKELSVLKKLADKHKLAILLIHHLRKEDDSDIFNRISGTTAIQGAVDSSFTLVEKVRGSGRATLSCIGRDFDFREIELQRNKENVWEVNKSMRHYIAFLQKENDNEFLTPALESVLSGMLGGMEDRIARIIFKLAVELSMTMHIIAAQNEIEEETLTRLRGFCVDEVKRLGGKISFDKAWQHQQGDG